MGKRLHNTGRIMKGSAMSDDLVKRLEDVGKYDYVPARARKAIIEAAARIEALTSELAKVRAERDGLASAAGSAYYVLTYVEALSNDADTKAACAEVRAEIDAVKKGQHHD
jgi:hypothetical protein